jgi:hypothetical protein
LRELGTKSEPSVRDRRRTRFSDRASILSGSSAESEAEFGSGLPAVTSDLRGQQRPMGLRTIVHSYKRRESYKQEVEHEEVIEDD